MGTFIRKNPVLQRFLVAIGKNTSRSNSILINSSFFLINKIIFITLLQIIKILMK